MNKSNAEMLIRKYQGDFLLDPRKECQYIEAVNVIINCIEDGYTLCKVDEVLAKMKVYKADGDLVAEDECRECGDNVFGSIEKFIKEACK